MQSLQNGGGFDTVMPGIGGIAGIGGALGGGFGGWNQGGPLSAAGCQMGVPSAYQALEFSLTQQQLAQQGITLQGDVLRGQGATNLQVREAEIQQILNANALQSQLNNTVWVEGQQMLVEAAKNQGALSKEIAMSAAATQLKVVESAAAQNILNLQNFANVNDKLCCIKNDIAALSKQEEVNSTSALAAILASDASVKGCVAAGTAAVINNENIQFANTNQLIISSAIADLFAPSRPVTLSTTLSR